MNMPMRLWREAVGRGCRVSCCWQGNVCVGHWLSPGVAACCDPAAPLCNLIHPLAGEPPVGRKAYPPSCLLPHPGPAGKGRGWGEVAGEPCLCTLWSEGSC